MDRATYWAKANAAAEAWNARFGTDPAAHLHALELVMAVAMHETALGSAWHESHNWGAVQRRQMTPAEKAIVAAGGVPSPRDAFEELHGDSSPVNGKYQTWFWKFPDGVPTARGQSGDVAGADKLLETLIDNHASIRAVIDTASTDKLAELMYAAGYYEGVHDPRVPGGREANIADYASALAAVWGPLTTALVGWSPGAVLSPAPPVTLPDLTTTRGVQIALNALGASPRLVEDGIAGPKTKAAVVAFQKAHGLAPDGIVGPLTRAALKKALGG